MKEASAFTLNPDIKARDEILFDNGFQHEEYCAHGGVRYFENVSYEKLLLLIEGSFLDASDSRGTSPTFGEFVEFMKTHEGFLACGWACAMLDGDPLAADTGWRLARRIVINGLRKVGDVDGDRRDFYKLFRLADSVTDEEDELSCHYY